MKKFLIFALCGIFALSACERKKNVKPEVPQADTTEVVAPFLDVEHIIGLDREIMYAQYQQDFRWYETCVTLDNYLDDEENEANVTSVSNIFMYAVDKADECYDTYVVLFAHTQDTTVIDVKEYAFWVGDQPLNNAEIDITFAEAYQRLLETDVIKPHSKQCVLRKELGPTPCNPQYIFGNVQSQLYVDAVTGEVSISNPAYKGYEDKLILREPVEWP